MTLVETIAKNVEEKRKALGISVDRLSKTSNISLSALNKLRKGKSAYLRIETVYALSRALECSIDELLK